MLGLDRFDENLLCMYRPFNDIIRLLTNGIVSQSKYFSLCSHGGGPEDDALFDSLGKTAIQQLDAYAREIGADNEFIYLNYADPSQNPLRSYGEENLAEIRRVAEKYDPEHVFQDQVPGGFKVSRA